MIIRTVLASEPTTIVGPWLKSQRECRQITVAQIAGRSRLAVSSIYAVESGSRTPTIDFIRRYARAIGCHLDLTIEPNEYTTLSQSANNAHD